MKPLSETPRVWQQFAASLAFTIFLPIVPLVIEAWYEGKVTAQSLTLATAIYAATIGISSRNAMLLVPAVLVSLIFAAVFGRVMNSGEVPSGCGMASVISLLAISAIHVSERYRRHVLAGEAFIQMEGGKS